MKSIIVAAFSVLFSVQGFALTHIVDRPGYDSLSPQQQEVVSAESKPNAKTDTNIPAVSADNQVDDQSSAQTAEQDEETDEHATPVAETEKQPEGFSVRLVSLHAQKTLRPSLKTAGKKTALAKSDTNFTIQLSSFLTEQEAKTALETFQKNKVADLWMSTADALGKTRYRVYSGHFKTLTAARAARAKAIEQSGVKQAFAQKVFAKLTAKNG
jgi:hypothetical protein